jgi:hypothetical protein
MHYFPNSLPLFTKTLPCYAKISNLLKKKEEEEEEEDNSRVLKQNTLTE